MFHHRVFVGRPFNIITNVDANNDQSTQTDRPSVNPDGTLCVPGAPGCVTPLITNGRFSTGNLPRNSGMTHSFMSVDMRVSRAIRFGERYRIDLIAEGFNLFNRFNEASASPFFTDVNAFAQRAGNGRYFSRPTAAYDARQFQLGEVHVLTTGYIHRPAGRSNGRPVFLVPTALDNCVVQTLADEIKQHALELGFAGVGIVEANALDVEGRRLQAWLGRGFHGQMSWMEREPERRADPRLLMDGARSVIVTTLNYFTAHQHGPTGKISRYAWGDDYHDVLREKLNALLAFVKQQVPIANGKVCVDTAPFMDKAWTARAGWAGSEKAQI